MNGIAPRRSRLSQVRPPAGLEPELVLGDVGISILDLEDKLLEKHVGQLTWAGRLAELVPERDVPVRLLPRYVLERLAEQVVARIEVVGRRTQRDAGLFRDGAMRDGLTSRAADDAERGFKDLLSPS